MSVPRPRAREHRKRRAGVRLRSGCARPLERARGERGGEPRRSGTPRRARVLLARRPRRVELRVHRPDSAGARSRLECLGHRARARRRLRRDRTHPGRGGAAGTRCRARRAPRQSRGRAGGRRLSDVGGADRARRGAPTSRSRRPRPCRIRLHRGSARCAPRTRAAQRRVVHGGTRCSARRGARHRLGRALRRGARRSPARAAPRFECAAARPGARGSSGRCARGDDLGVWADGDRLGTRRRRSPRVWPSSPVASRMSTCFPCPPRRKELTRCDEQSLRPPVRPCEACQRRPDRRSRPSGCTRDAQGDGLHRRGSGQAHHRRRHDVDRDHAVQPQSARPRDRRETRHPRRRGNADGVQHDRGVGRRFDGHVRDARVPRLARGDRRLHRARRARSPLRRSRVPRRLRQDHPRCRHGARAARHPGSRLLHGLDRARSLPRPRRVDRRRLRGDRRVRGREDERRGATRARIGCLPRRGSVRRPVHRQHDVDDDRLPRPDTAGCERDPGRERREGRGGVRDRQARRGGRPGRPAPIDDRHEGGGRERCRRDRRDGRLDERGSPPRRDRARVRHRLHDRRLRPHLGGDADRGRHEAVGALPRDGRLPGRRRGARRARAPRRCARPRRRALRRRAYARRRRRRGGGDGRPDRRRADRHAAQVARRRRDPPRQPLAGGLRRQARRARPDDAPRPGPRLRLGGGVLRSGEGPHESRRATSS